jgi:hypothetical protein
MEDERWLRRLGVIVLYVGCGVALRVLGEHWETVGRTERFSHNSVGGWIEDG